jgi:hypothetical protein
VKYLKFQTHGSRKQWGGWPGVEDKEEFKPCVWSLNHERWKSSRVLLVNVMTVVNNTVLYT